MSNARQTNATVGRGARASLTALATIVLMTSAFGWVRAQGFTGSYAGDVAIGPIVVELWQDGARVQGTLRGSGVAFDLDGEVAASALSGWAVTAEGTVGFEAYLHGETLGLYLFDVDARGEPVVESVVELLLTRRGGATTAPVAQDPAPPPFSARTADPLVGTFSDGDVTLEVQTVSGEYAAEIRSGGETYQIEMGAATTGLAGRFMSGGFAYDFTADLHGDVMILTTGGTTYRLQRRGDPFGTPTDATSPGSGAQELLAVGPHASLRRDDAVAFIEALEFVLSQLGYPYRFDGAEREEAIELLAQAFPHASHHDQLVLADARTIWERVQVGWSAASEREQREFALGVLILAFGEETVRGWVGATGFGGGATLGGGAGCSTFEECTSRFVDERTWTDTFNSQGCWAAAGCDSYDGSTGSFTYSDDY